MKSIVDFTKFTNFLYIYIAAIIVGSILGMDRQVLIKGFLKIFVPLGVGSIAAGAVGTLVGTLLGLGPYKTFFFIVVPIMAGGVGEGAIPLSIGYSAILGQPQGDLFAQVLPPVMLGSLTAIIFSGMLNFVGKKYPQLTGEGRLQPAGVGEDLTNINADEKGSTVDITLAEAGGRELDMGTPFDFFSPRSSPADPSVAGSARANRALLAAAMRRRGFRPYAKEWWHFTLAREPFPATYFDLPVR